MATENELNLDRNWTFDINLSGLTVQAAAPKDVPKGYYKAKVEDMYVNVDKNAGRVIIKLMISEGEFRGAVRTDGISIPKSEDDKVRYYWRAFAESAGYTPAQLDNGGIKLSPSAFKDREVHIHYIPKNEAAGVQYDKIEYLTPSDFVARKANGTTSTAPALGTSAPKADTVSKGDVFAKLGIS